MSETVKESIRTLLSEIIDYAGLFPPSKLSMAESVTNYAAYKNSNYNWMLGRFVVPVVRLDEFLESSEEFISRDADGGWRLSVLAGEDIYETFRKIEDFNAENSTKAVCDAIEIKADAPSLIETATEILPPNIKAYFEISPEGDLAEMISTLAINRQRAKIRTGGVTPEVFPTSKSIIRFVRTCLAANVPFKATAGLHHPVRCLKPLTYEANAPEGVMNGFLNLFLMTGFARGGFKPNLLVELLEDESAENFKFDESGAHWREDYFLSNSQLKVVRERNIISFGSCSFEEPIEDLQGIGLL